MGRLRRASRVPYEPYSVALRRLLRDLRKDRAAFLVGAGVSMLEPSNLPSGDALKDACVEALRAAEPGLPAYVTLLRRDKRYWRVVPELVFQKFFEVLLGRFHHYFIHLGLSDPNQGHGVLGTVAAGGVPVLTTNFDDLIERAASITRGVLHLHGHLGKPPEMVVRINQIGRGLSRQLRAAMLRAIECRTVYVLGYSGADPEIMGALAAASLHRIVWFARPPVEPAVRQNVGRLALQHDCTIVVADLRKLFTDVGRQYGVIPPKRPDRRRERVRHVKDWALKLTSAERWACVGDVFTLVERYEQARDVYLEGMRFADCRLGLLP